MLAKLLSLLLHAKSGAISGVLLLGATGALVSVSASNGVTTITITEASPSPATSVSTTTTTNATNQTTDTDTETPEAGGQPGSSSSSVSSTACNTVEASALATQVQRVNSAFSGFHTDLMHLRGLRAAATIETADVTLKVIRQAAVKAIHATATETCAKQDDEDENDNDQNDKTDNEQTGENDTNDATSVVGAAAATTTSSGDDNNNAENNGGDHGKTTVAPVTFTGDATSIATRAIGLMQDAFTAANTAPVVAATPAHAPEQKTNSTKKSGSDHHD